MKKIIIPVLALIAGAAFVSCESQLDIEQKGVISEENFYKTDADCEKALASAYEYFTIQTMGRTTFGPSIYTPNKVMGNHPGDDVLYAGGNYGDHEFGGSVNEFRFKHTPEAIDAMYKGLYSSVYYCNTVLNYFENKEGATAFMKQAVAEARVLRAYDYFLLACYWGQPPLVDKLLSADALPSNNQKTQKDYFLWVANQCDSAYNDLTSRNGQGDKAGAVRVTKGFADALAGKAYIFAGDYDKAKASLKRVVESGNYDLVDGTEFANLFHVEGDCNKEKVFEINMEYNSAVSSWSFGSGLGAYHHSTWMEANCFCWREGNMALSPIKNYNGGIGGWGSIGIPEWYGDAFQANDGDSYRRKATIINVEDAFYQKSGLEGMSYSLQSLETENIDTVSIKATKEWGDLITYAKKDTVVTEGKTTYRMTLDLNSIPVDDLKKSKVVGINNIDQGLYGNSFWLGFKHLARGTDMKDGGGSHGSNLRLNNIIVMRYAEVLLLYAEACINASTPDLTTALTCLNKIQNRAGSAHVSTVANMTELKNEKLFELWFEGCRYQDILRWNDTEGKDRLAKAGSAVPHLYDKLYRAPKAGEEVTWQHDTESNSRFYIVHTHEAKDAGYDVGFKEGINNLFPYPSDALDQNTNLHQNPGY